MLLHYRLVFGVLFASLGVLATARGESSAEAVAALEKELSNEGADLAELANKSFATIPLSQADAEKTRALLWKHHAARLAKERKAEYDARKLTDDKLEMPFFIKPFGEKPKAGHSVWISLHGGGNAPPQVNNGQWENQKRLYKLEEGLYVVPRAPTNTWNLWHEGHIDRMFDRLIEDLVVLEGIDSNRIYVMGYSAGGDGVYQLGPRMADRWAAAAMMAGHPNESQPLGLRNVPFSIQVGERDGGYNRNKVAQEWGEKLAELHKADPQGYVHDVKIHAGKGHWMNGEDAAILPWMAKQRRNPTPERIVWKQDDVTHDRLYWLATPAAAARGGALVVAARKGQTITIEKAEDVAQLKIRIDSRVANADEPIRVVYGDKELFAGKANRNLATQLATLLGRGDPELIFDAEIEVTLTSK